MCLDPLPHLAWSEGAYRMLQEIPSADILTLQIVFLEITGGDITSSST